MTLTLPTLTLGDTEAAIADLEENVRGYAVIDMASDDYSMSAAESLNTNLVILNPGDGTKVLTVNLSPDNPAGYDVIIIGGGTIRFYDGTTYIPIFTLGRVLYLHGTGIIQNLSTVDVACQYTNVTSAPNTITAQTLQTVYLPSNTFAANGDEMLMRFNLSKSEVTNTVTTTVTVDGQTIWTNATLATTNDHLAIGIAFVRTSATTLKMSSVNGSSSLFGPTTAAFGSITVSDLSTTGVDLKINVTQNAVSATETTTLNSVNAKLTRATL